MQLEMDGSVFSQVENVPDLEDMGVEIGWINRYMDRWLGG